ncbi:MAG TPA: hypothetical protein DD738_12160 [Ruminiclostridium sp.]|jgi:uncharacterized protein YcfL|nr:hypothetical protein [Ruminiclostridium sp.]
MKKVLILTLVAVLLAGCGSTSVKTGLGHNISIAKSTDATAEEEGAAQVDTIMAAVTFDSKGKILGVQIDNAQVAVNFDAAGKITSDKASQPQTKVEAGDNYGMKKKSSIGKEWYEQIADLEKWMVGKTVDEVNAMKVKKVDEDHPAVPDIADLSSKVTISVADYQAAVTEALANAR